MAPFATVLEIHELTYFLQVSGEPLNLNFIKAKHEPIAENLQSVLNLIEGHYISGYEDTSEIASNELKLLPDARKKAFDFLSASPETLARVNKVGELVDGFESAFGLELLATVHWVMHSGKAYELSDIVCAVHSWGPEKEKFSERQIQNAFNALDQGGW